MTAQLSQVFPHPLTLFINLTIGSFFFLLNEHRSVKMIAKKSNKIRKTALSHVRGLWIQYNNTVILFIPLRNSRETWKVMSEYNNEIFFLWILNSLSFRTILRRRLVVVYVLSTHPKIKYSNAIEKKHLLKQKQVFFLMYAREMSDSFGIEMMRRVSINWILWLINASVL